MIYFFSEWKEDHSLQNHLKLLVYYNILTNFKLGGAIWSIYTYKSQVQTWFSSSHLFSMLHKLVRLQVLLAFGCPMRCPKLSDLSTHRFCLDGIHSPSVPDPYRQLCSSFNPGISSTVLHEYTLPGLNNLLQILYHWSVESHLDWYGTWILLMEIRMLGVGSNCQASQ